MLLKGSHTNAELNTTMMNDPIWYTANDSNWKASKYYQTLLLFSYVESNRWSWSKVQQNFHLPVHGDIRSTPSRRLLSRNPPMVLAKKLSDENFSISMMPGIPSDPAPPANQVRYSLINIFNNKSFCSQERPGATLTDWEQQAEVMIISTNTA